MLDAQRDHSEYEVYSNREIIATRTAANARYKNKQYRSSRCNFFSQCFFVTAVPLLREMAQVSSLVVSCRHEAVHVRGCEPDDIVATAFNIQNGIQLMCAS